MIGSRGLSAWPALLLGSVSEGVAHHASCPVLVVRGEPISSAALTIYAWKKCLVHALASEKRSFGSR